jgi:hypothetical protein
MNNEIAKRTQTRLRDNFGWEPDANDEIDRPTRSMQGEVKLKFNSPDWSVQGVKCNGRELIVYDKTYSVVRWSADNKMPEEVIPLERGAPHPNLKEMNAAIPRTQWKIGLDGNPEAPYQLQRVLEFLDPKTMERLSWPHNVTVVGSSIAAEELEGRILIIRRLRGENVYPLVKLVSKFMPTRWGGRQRPYLEILDWVRLGEHGIETDVQPQLQGDAKAKSKPAQQSALPLRPVSKVTTAEELDDTIPW